LTTTVTGKQGWSLAIDHIRKGGAPPVEKLLKVMQEDFPGNPELKQLVKLL